MANPCGCPRVSVTDQNGEPPWSSLRGDGAEANSTGVPGCPRGPLVSCTVAMLTGRPSMMEWPYRPSTGAFTYQDSAYGKYAS